MDKLGIRIAEAAEMVSVSRSTMVKYINSGLVKSVKIGKARIIPVEELRRFLEENATANE